MHVIAVDFGGMQRHHRAVQDYSCDAPKYMRRKERQYWATPNPFR